MRTHRQPDDAVAFSDRKQFFDTPFPPKWIKGVPFGDGAGHDENVTNIGMHPRRRNRP